jgi:hypothetical protein
MNSSAKLILNISDFTILKAIGKGGFATVYLAKKNDTNKLYAVKVRRYSFDCFLLDLPLFLISLGNE